MAPKSRNNFANKSVDHCVTFGADTPGATRATLDTRNEKGYEDEKREVVSD